MTLTISAEHKENDLDRRVVHSIFICQAARSGYTSNGKLLARLRLGKFNFVTGYRRPNQRQTQAMFS